jgi:hypothetical protein
MKLNEIISKEISKYINRIINEEYEEKDKDDDNNSGIKKHGFDQYQNELKALHDNGELNYRQLASNIYGIPTSTKSKATVSKLNSKASALRKKIEGEPAPSGGHYHLTATDASNIAQELSSI